MGNDCKPHESFLSQSMQNSLECAYSPDIAISEFYREVCNQSKFEISQSQRSYVINEKELGRGAVGVVKECLEEFSQRSFAVKSIPKTEQSTDGLQRIRVEVLALKCLSHPNIIGLEDVYEDNEYIHLVLPMCNGGDLLKRMVARLNSPKRTHTEDEALIIVQRMLEAIYCCHRHGIIHRDIKPENFIFVSESQDSLMKLCDFGLSIFQTDIKCTLKPQVGSPYYMAPEIIRQSNYTTKCDIWGVGIIFFMLLAGKMPFKATTLETLFQEIASEAPISFEDEIWEAISVQTKELVRSFLEKDPNRRLSAKAALNHRIFKQITRCALES